MGDYHLPLAPFFAPFLDPQKLCNNNQHKHHLQTSPKSFLETQIRQTREMGLYAFSLAGGSLVLIGAWEALISSVTLLHSPSRPPSSSNQPPKQNPFLSSITYISLALLSLFFIFDSLISLADALHTKDNVGFAHQLQIISILALFFLYSVTGLFVNHVKTIALSPSIPNLVALFAFGQEFFFFYTQKKNPNGVENQYYNLLLAPIAICFFSTVLLLGSSNSSDSKFPRMARGVSLILQGTWFIQMGFSFYTDFMTHGCNLVEKSRGNFTVKCKGHDDYHRSKAISTLQFNCHLSLLVVLITGVYSIIARMYGIERNHLNYKPLNAELSQLGHQTQFTLDSDDDDHEAAADENGAKPMGVGVGRKLGVNGFGAH